MDLQLRDTQGQEEYDRVRKLSYRGSDVVLVCFDIGNPDTLDNVTEKVSIPAVYYVIRTDSFSCSGLLR